MITDLWILNGNFYSARDCKGNNYNLSLEIIFFIVKNDISDELKYNNVRLKITFKIIDSKECEQFRCFEESFNPIHEN